MFLFPVSKHFINDMHVDKLHILQAYLQYKFYIYQA